MSRKGGSYIVSESGETVMVREGGKGPIVKVIAEPMPKAGKPSSNKSTKED